MPDPLNESQPERRFDHEAALQFLYGRIDYERLAGPRNEYRFRLENTAELFRQLGLEGFLHRSDRPEQTGSPEEPGSPEEAGPCGQAEPPRPCIPTVHIAGTKGKGSTASMISSVLSAAGYRVGLYTSPHLVEVEERFQIDGLPCSREALVELVASVAPVVERFEASGRPVSFFELTTAMAVLHFHRHDCDAIVLEVGLGGRLDSTNVCAASVAAITSIGLDHQHLLGDTIGAIAAEKAGIIKAAIPVVSGATQAEARDAIRAASQRAAAPLLEVDQAYRVAGSEHPEWGCRVTYEALSQALVPPGQNSRSEFALALDGLHQAQNAGVAISVLRLLARQRLSPPLRIGEDQIAEGLRRVRCIGRLERFRLPATPATAADQRPQPTNEQPTNEQSTNEQSTNEQRQPPASVPAQQASDPAPRPIEVILDTAHNKDSMAALCAALRTRVPPQPPTGERPSNHEPPRERGAAPAPRQAAGPIRRPLIAVFATSRDKDVDAMAASLLELADQIVCTQYTTNPRAIQARDLAETLTQKAAQMHLPIDALLLPRVVCQPDPLRAFRQAVDQAAGRDAQPAGRDAQPTGRDAQPVPAAGPGTVIICGSFFLAGQLRPPLLAWPGVTPVPLAAGGHGGTAAWGAKPSGSSLNASPLPD